MSPFLRNVLALRELEQEARVLNTPGSALYGTPKDEQIGRMRGGIATKARAAQLMAERAERIARLRALGMDTHAIAARLGLSYRQVRFAERP